MKEKARMRYRLASLIGFVFFVVSARADDANWVAVGSAGSFKPNPHIRMRRESVDVRLTNTEVIVRARFWFENLAGARDVTMAFPDETCVNSGASGAITSFRSAVDGQRAVVRRQKVKTKDRFQVSHVWLKKVHFGRHQRRVVDVWYSANHGFAGNNWCFDTYVFETGATWSGTIGRIDATVDWSAMTHQSKPTLELTAKAPGARWTRAGFKRSHLTVLNVKPRFNLDLTSITGFWNFRLNGRSLPQNLGTPGDGSPVIEGLPNDLRICASQLGKFFGAYGDEVKDWSSPVARAFGRSLVLVGPRTIRTGNGRRLRLARRATNEKGHSVPQVGDESYIYLRDLVRCLGGRYRYAPSEDRVYITLPTKGRRSHRVSR